MLRELLEQRDLADRCAGHAFVLGIETDLLERHHLAGLGIATLVHDTVGAFTELLVLGVAQSSRTRRRHDDGGGSG